jgi:hypothetical protein
MADEGWFVVVLSQAIGARSHPTDAAETIAVLHGFQASLDFGLDQNYNPSAMTHLSVSHSTSSR